MTARASIAAAALAVLVLANAPSFAQSGGSIEAKIPFDFAVGGRALGPADYIIDLAGTTEPNMLSIRAKDGSVKLMFDTEQIAEKRDPEMVELVFDTMGDTNYLVEVWGLTNSGRGVKNIV